MLREDWVRLAKALKAARRDLIVSALAWAAYFFVFKDVEGSAAKGTIILVGVIYPLYSLYTIVQHLKSNP